MDETEAVEALGRSIEIAVAIVREGDIRRHRYSDEEKTAIAKMKNIVKKLQDEELI